MNDATSAWLLPSISTMLVTRSAATAKKLRVPDGGGLKSRTA